MSSNNINRHECIHIDIYCSQTHFFFFLIFTYYPYFFIFYIYFYFSSVPSLFLCFNLRQISLLFILSSYLSTLHQLRRYFLFIYICILEVYYFVLFSMQTPFLYSFNPNFSPSFHTNYCKIPIEKYSFRNDKSKQMNIILKINSLT